MLTIANDSNISLGASNPTFNEEHEHPNTYADLIVHYLEALGIEVVFGVPGGAIEPLLNSLARSERRGGPRLVVARHECGAAFMADGYYREKGKMGVVCSTTGPGATNLITGVASAQADEIPMLVITAQTPLPKFGKRALQESSCTAVDVVGIFRHVTQFNTLVSHHEQMETKLVSAIMAAHRAPHGPAHVSIPADILRTPADIKPNIHSDLLVHDFCMCDDKAVARLTEKLGRVDNIVMYLGNGIGEANEQVMEFIELTNAAFVSGPIGKSWVDETHPQYRGVYGFAGHESAKALFKDRQVDLIIAVGTALGELGTSGWTDELLNSKLVHIDASIEHFTRSPMANLHVFGNIGAIFSRLTRYVREVKIGGKQWHNISPELQQPNILGGYTPLAEPEKCLEHSQPIKPQRLMHQLCTTLPEETRVFVDAGNAWSWATHYFNRSNHNGYYRVAMGFGSMGWSIGAAVGAAVANPEAPMLCIVGDGSYLMSAQEITVASQQGVPVVFILLNDAAMGMVMHGQRLGGQESIGWELNSINYAAQVQAMGINAHVIETPEQLSDIDWNDLFSRQGPTLLDVRIDKNEVPPMGDRVKGLSANAPATPGA